MNRARGRDDTGSLAVATLLLVVAFLLTALLLPMVTNQLRATRTSEARDRALNAAQAGVQAAVGQIRAAVDGSGAGLVSALPGCTVSGEPGLGVGTRVRYRVTIRYRSDVGADLGCTPAQPPARADLVALGSVTARTGGALVAQRSVDATYTFRSEAKIVPGGPIYFVPPSPTSPDLCQTAGTAAPGTNTPLRAALCAAGDAAQTFVYNRRLQLVAANSISASRPRGMCVQASGIGATAVFRPCADPAPAAQQWSFIGTAMFESAATAGHCLTLDGYSAGSAQTLQPCNGGTIWQLQVTGPDATTGAGAAGPATKQLVNFDQFGRCLDVTLSALEYAHLIIWPCKQSPDPADIDWNQRWTVPAPAANGAPSTGAITLQPSGEPQHCLRSPQSAAAGAYVVVIPCPSGTLPANLRWTVYRHTGLWTTSYRVRDASGLCLAPTDPDAADPDLYLLHGHEISKSVVRPCDDSTAQKWNADPFLLGPTPIHFVGER